MRTRGPTIGPTSIFQTSLLSAVMRGVYDGDTTIATLLEHGDFGLGTFNALDGAMIVLDGIAYRLTGDGSAGISPANALNPLCRSHPL